jgi:predicted phosphodiesterase
MKKIFIFFAYFLMLISNLFAQKTQEFYEKTVIKDLQNPKDAFNFLVVGDWGRNGHYNQQQVADRMDETAHHLDVEFIISVGDNFYSDGVMSVDDPQWRTSFENVYNGANLLVNWYPILGNHDYRGNPQAQIDYSKKSRRWNMPSAYYTFERTLDDDSGEKILFVFIDTNPFERKYYTDETYMFTDVVKQDTLKQLNWLNQTLAQSTAKWKIVIGHHPLYTTGKRIKETPYVRYSLESILEKHKVDAYFCGHEHDLQHQKRTEMFTNHFTSGAGSEARPVSAPQTYTKFAKAEHGFMAVSATAKGMLVQVINDKGEVIYKTMIGK